MSITRTWKYGVVNYAIKTFLLFFIIFILLQVSMYFVSKAILPYHIFIEDGGWILKTTILVFMETIIYSLVSAGLYLLFVHKIIGPIARLTKQLTQMEETGEITHLRVRENDKLKELIEIVNKIIKKNGSN